MSLLPSPNPPKFNNPPLVGVSWGWEEEGLNVNKARSALTMWTDDAPCEQYHRIIIRCG